MNCNNNGILLKKCNTNISTIKRGHRRVACVAAVPGGLVPSIIITFLKGWCFPETNWQIHSKVPQMLFLWISLRFSKAMQLLSCLNACSYIWDFLCNYCKNLLCTYVIICLGLFIYFLLLICIRSKNKILNCDRILKNQSYDI